jgi:phenylacetyl-CoA:acceptor oxidoreductase subunit 2
MRGKLLLRGAESWMQDHWDIRAAGNFICGGTGAGFLAISAASALAGGQTVMPLVLLGLAFVGLGLFCVWLEIGRMLRAVNVIFHPQTSWMTREALAAAPLFAVGLYAAWFRDTDMLLATAALGMVFLYCQGRILMAAKGIPAWREPTIMPFILLTGLAEGAALMASIGWFLVPANYLFWLPPAFLILVALRYVAWRMHQKHMIMNGMPKGALKAFRTYNPVIFLGGNLAPTALLGLGYVLPYPAGLYVVILGAVLALLGGWLMKYVLITKAAFNQGFQLPHVPVRGQGKPGPSVKPGWTVPGRTS